MPPLSFAVSACIAPSFIRQRTAPLAPMWQNKEARPPLLARFGAPWSARRSTRLSGADKRFRTPEAQRTLYS